MQMLLCLHVRVATLGQASFTSRPNMVWHDAIHCGRAKKSATQAQCILTWYILLTTTLVLYTQSSNRAGYIGAWLGAKYVSYKYMNWNPAPQIYSMELIPLISAGTLSGLYMVKCTVEKHLPTD